MLENKKTPQLRRQVTEKEGFKTWSNELQKSLQESTRLKIKAIQQQSKDTKLKDAEKQQTERLQTKKEFIKTEIDYVNYLDTLINIFKAPLEEKQIITKQQSSNIFRNVETIYAIHKEMATQLNKLDEDLNFVPILSKFAPYFKLYENYVNGADITDYQIKHLIKENPKYVKRIAKCEENPMLNKRRLKDFLIMPVQRLPRCTLLLERLIKNTSNSTDREEIQTLYATLLEVNNALDLSKKRQDAKVKLARLQHDFDEDILKPGRTFVNETNIESCKCNSKTLSKYLKDKPIPFKRMSLYLFNDVILFVQVTSKAKDTTSCAPTSASTTPGLVSKAPRTASLGKSEKKVKEKYVQKGKFDTQTLVLRALPGHELDSPPILSAALKAAAGASVSRALTISEEEKLTGWVQKAENKLKLQADHPQVPHDRTLLLQCQNRSKSYFYFLKFESVQDRTDWYGFLTDTATKACGRIAGKVLISNSPRKPALSPRKPTPAPDPVPAASNTTTSTAVRFEIPEGVTDGTSQLLALKDMRNSLTSQTAEQIKKNGQRFIDEQVEREEDARKVRVHSALPHSKRSTIGPSFTGLNSSQLRALERQNLIPPSRQLPQTTDQISPSETDKSRKTPPSRRLTIGASTVHASSNVVARFQQHLLEKQRQELSYSRNHTPHIPAPASRPTVRDLAKMWEKSNS